MQVRGSGAPLTTRVSCTGWILAQSSTTHLPDAVSLSKKDSVIAETSFNLKSMSGKTGSSSNSVIQAQKLVDQLRVEAGMERIKVRTGVICQCMYLIVLPLLFIFSRIRNDTHTVCYINDFINVILFQRQKQKIYQHILHIKDRQSKQRMLLEPFHFTHTSKMLDISILPCRSHWQQEIWCGTVRNTGEATL